MSATVPLGPPPEVEHERGDTVSVRHKGARLEGVVVAVDRRTTLVQVRCRGWWVRAPHKDVVLLRRARKAVLSHRVGGKLK